MDTICIPFEIDNYSKVNITFNMEKLLILELLYMTKIKYEYTHYKSKQL